MKAWKDGCATSPRILRAKDLDMLRSALRLDTTVLRRIRTRKLEDMRTEVVYHWTLTIGEVWVSVTDELAGGDAEVWRMLNKLARTSGLLKEPELSLAELFDND